jgi:hypothetical protein
MHAHIRAALAAVALVSAGQAQAQDNADFCIAARSILSYFPDRLKEIGGAKDDDGDMAGTIRFPLARRCWVKKSKKAYSCLFRLPLAAAEAQNQALANVVDTCFPGTAGMAEPAYHSWNVGGVPVRLSRTDMSDEAVLLLAFGDLRAK